ncbi:MAG: hypothetical protein EOP22_16910 [Hyphomicrobiales bacterium]|nr:MAG: hypothetical protein EOP22_16910 [Hyphomicrobiales bacterium]
MTNKLKLATALMIGAALAATPVLAQAVTSGNRGPAEIPVNRDAPFNLPGPVNPAPTPQLDTSTSRDLFAFDPALLLESFGTVSLQRGGDVVEIPASDAQRAIVEQLVKGNSGN